MKKTIFSAMALLLGAVAGCGSSGSSGACATVTCQASQFCDAATGTCKEASVCAGVSCTAGTVCDGTAGSTTAGKCVAQTCGATQCTNGQVCSQATATCVNPGVPALGVQIDRMGRPAVNTALTNPYGVSGAQPSDTTDITRAYYNADADQTKWSANWLGAITANLAVLDGLDATVLGGQKCGNQFAYNVPANGKYATLATTLANDALLMDTTKTACTQYLAVEVGLVTGTPATTCGGRTLSYDVIDTTYSALAAGTLTGVTDGIAEVTKPAAAFPYFQPPI
jgi:hypothetical protein